MLKRVTETLGGLQETCREPSRLFGVGKQVLSHAVNAGQEVLDTTRTIFNLDEPTYKGLGYRINHESLTHTLTREGLFAATEEFAQNNDCQDFTAVFVDLKGFKSFNDEFGHLMGDNALRAAGWGMKQLFRLPDGWKHPKDTRSLVARLGGDEFIGLLPKGDDLDEMLGSSLIYETIRERSSDDEGDSVAHTAEWNVRDFLTQIDETKLPRDAVLALHVIGATGIPIIFRYDIGKVTLTDDGAESAVVKFLEKHGSKYVRVSDLVKE